MTAAVRGRRALRACGVTDVTDGTGGTRRVRGVTDGTGGASCPSEPRRAGANTDRCYQLNIRGVAVTVRRHATHRTEDYCYIIDPAIVTKPPIPIENNRNPTLCRSRIQSLS